MIGVDRMLELARSDTSVDRERLLMSIADLCESSSDCSGAALQGLLHDIFMDVVAEAERDFRLRLACKLAAAAWAPRALVTLLARDEIEIARPVIAQSPLLQNHDLIRLLVEASIEHQIEVARRPRLDAEVIGAILDQGDSSVLAALADNSTAEVSALSMQRLVSFSQRVAAIRAPLTRHPRLTGPLGALLYRWVGESLREALSERFATDSEAFRKAIEKTIDEYGGTRDVVAAANDRDAMDRRMVEKLSAAGQLRAGLLIRSLNEGKLGLFKAGLCALASLSDDEVVAALNADGPELLAQACAKVGIDRSAFNTVLAYVRALNRGRPGLGAAAAGTAKAAPAEAGTAKAAIAGVASHRQARI